MRPTRRLATDPDSPDPAVVAEAAAILRAGGLVAFATETVYGLGAVATDEAAVAGIFEAKGRPSTNPLIVHAANVNMAMAYAAIWPRAAALLADAFWPGPLTIVVPKTPAIPDLATAGQPTVGLRVPGLAVARRLIEVVGAPLAAPSANRSNGISPTTADHVFMDLDGRIDAILDSGPCPAGLESTVVDLSDGPPAILRPGPIAALRIALALEVWPIAEGGERGRSPGQSSVHYAPRTPTYRVEVVEELVGREFPTGTVGLRFGPSPASNVFPQLGGGSGDCSNPHAAARNLYALLRRLDAGDPPMILIVMPPDEPEWRAVRDRLLRASRPLGGHVK